MVKSKISFFTSRMDSAGENRDTCFFVNYKRGLTLPKTELDSMSKRKLTTKFEEEPSFAGDGISNQERECVGLRKRASVSGIRNNDTAYFQLLAYVSRNYHVPLYSRL